MTSRERLTKTFKGLRADRVPLSPFLWHNNIYEMFKHKPRMDSAFNPEDFDLAAKFIEYNDSFGFDTLFSLGYLQDKFVPETADNWDVEITGEGDEDSQQRVWKVHTPGGDVTQVINFRRSSPYLIVVATEKYLIEEKADFEIVRKFMPAAECIDCGLVSRASAAIGDKGLVNPVTCGVFNTLNMFRKLDTMMMDPVVDEGFYRELMSYFTEWSWTPIREAIRAGADSIELGGNLATSGVGPDFFKEYVMDYENTLALRIHGEGAMVVYHNCGDAQKIMHLYNDLDIDVWGYVTGQPFGDVVLEDALRTIRPDMALRGNIDQVEFMRKATPALVKEKVRGLMDKVKPRGNWILSTTDFFFDDQSYDNIRAFAEAGREYGRY